MSQQTPTASSLFSMPPHNAKRFIHCTAHAPHSACGWLALRLATPTTTFTAKSRPDPFNTHSKLTHPASEHSPERFARRIDHQRKVRGRRLGCQQLDDDGHEGVQH